jgi:hypothetical protein
VFGQLQSAKPCPEGLPEILHRYGLELPGGRQPHQGGCARRGDEQAQREQSFFALAPPQLRVRAQGLEPLQAYVGYTHQDEVRQHRLGLAGLGTAQAQQLFGIAEKDCHRPSAPIPPHVLGRAQAQLAGGQGLGAVALGVRVVFDHRELDRLAPSLDHAGAGAGPELGVVRVIGGSHRSGDLLEGQRAALGAHPSVVLEAGDPGQVPAGKPAQIVPRGIPVVEQDQLHADPRPHDAPPPRPGPGVFGLVGRARGGAWAHPSSGLLHDPSPRTRGTGAPAVAAHFGPALAGPPRLGPLALGAGGGRVGSFCHTEKPRGTVSHPVPHTTKTTRSPKTLRRRA